MRIPSEGTAEEILEAFLGIPYRQDGAVADDGRHTLWASPGRVFPAPGLNCSGFMAAAARFLLGVNFPLDAARRDLLSDSGKGAPLGEDWDFGLDAALSLAGPGGTLFPWGGEYARIEGPDGLPVGLGTDVGSREFPEALAGLAPGRLYFFAVSKPDRRFAGGLSYYHNGIAVAREGGGIRLYHATGRAGVHRMELGSPAGVASFRKYYPPARGGRRRVVFVEASPPPCGGAFPPPGTAGRQSRAFGPPSPLP
jgi:cell wall-associated NlpC family hydrolase